MCGFFTNNEPVITLTSCSARFNVDSGFFIGSVNACFINSCISILNAVSNFHNTAANSIFTNCRAFSDNHGINYDNILNSANSVFIVTGAAVKSANYWMNAADF